VLHGDALGTPKSQVKAAPRTFQGTGNGRLGDLGDQSSSGDGDPLLGGMGRRSSEAGDRSFDVTGVAPVLMSSYLPEKSLLDLGNSLLSVLALGAGFLYAIAPPKATDLVANLTLGLKDLLVGNWFGNAKDSQAQKVLGVFLMRSSKGTERLVAARLTPQGLSVLFELELDSSTDINSQGFQLNLEAAVRQMLDTLSSEATSNQGRVLLDRRLCSQRSLIESMGEVIQELNPTRLHAAMDQSSQGELALLKSWLNKPSNTPPLGNSIYEALQQRISLFSKTLSSQEAMMAGLLELSLSLSSVG
jgi:hypothetical protein